MVAPTEEGWFHVSLFEGGAHVFDTDVPIDLSQFETESEIDDNSSALIDEAAQAAVDEFEASRGSLGQGAGVGKMATKKTAYWSSMDYADWYCTLKATSFKDQAEYLLEQYFSAIRDQSCGNQDQAQARRMAEEKLANLEYELNMLNLQRMKCAKPNETIIVIKAYRSDKEACGTLLEEFLDGFRGTKFEDQALAKMSEYLDVKKQLEGFYTEETKSLKQMFDIQEAMDELYVTALQQEVSDGVVDNSGVGADSNMAADVMSLMEGVTLDPMFEEQSEMPPALFANRVAQDSAYMDEPDRPMDDVLQDALAMVKSMKRSDPATIKNTIKAVYGLSDKDASDLVSYGKRGKRAQEEDSKEEQTLKIHIETYEGDEAPTYEAWNLYGNRVALADSFENLIASLKYKPYKYVQLSQNDGSMPQSLAGPLLITFPISEVTEDMVRKAKMAGKEDKENDGEYEVVELGKIHEGLDPAEVPLKDFPFAIGDKVTLSKAFEMPVWGGGTTELAKGTKGVIRNLYDGHGDAYMVTCEEGSTYCIPTEYLK